MTQSFLETFRQAYQQSAFLATLAQVRADVVTVLTPKAVPAEQIDPQAASQQLATALATLPKSEAEQEARQKAEHRARAQIHIAEKVSGEA